MNIKKKRPVGINLIIGPFLFLITVIASPSFAQDTKRAEKDKVETKAETDRTIHDTDDYDSFVQRPYDDDPVYIDDEQQNFINKYNVTDPDITDIYNILEENDKEFGLDKAEAEANADFNKIDNKQSRKSKQIKNNKGC